MNGCSQNANASGVYSSFARTRSTASRTISAWSKASSSSPLSSARFSTGQNRACMVSKSDQDSHVLVNLIGAQFDPYTHRFAAFKGFLPDAAHTARWLRRHHPGWGALP